MEVNMKVEWQSCFRVSISLFLLYLCITYWGAAVNFAGLVFGAAVPILIGCVMAFLVNIVMSFYEKHYFVTSINPNIQKSRRPVCMMAAFFSLIAVVYLIIMLVQEW